MLAKLKTFISKRPDAPLIAILVISVLLRLVSVAVLGNRMDEMPGVFDQISYHNLALRLLGGHGFTFGEFWWPATRAGEQTAHWSFLYTFYLTAVYGLFGPSPIAARIIQAVITGILHPLLTYKIGERMFGKVQGLLAAAFTAVYIYFFYYAATLMTEPFYITFILAALYITVVLVDPALDGRVRQRMGLAALLGLMLGGALLLRQLFLLMVPFVLFWVFWRVLRQKRVHGWLDILVPLAVIAAMIAPFTIFNYQRYGQFVLLNTNAGFAFYWGNHPIYGTKFVPILTEEMGSYFELIPEELLPLNEPALDQALLQRAIQFIVDDPWRYIQLSISRIPVYFQFWPSVHSGAVSNLSRVGSYLLFLPLMVYGLIRQLASGDLRKFSSPTWLVLLLTVAYTGLHLLTWALIRYRLPVDAIMLLFAAVACVDLYNRIKKPVKPLAAGLSKP